MIGVKFNGRLGNQIFQYAFYHYLRSNNKGIVFFTNPHHAYLSKYFVLDKFNRITLASKAYSMITRVLPKIFPFNEIYIQNIQTPRPISAKPWTIYKGFFQTDWYLKNLNGNLKLEIKKEFVLKFENLYGVLFNKNKTIVVHIRRTDYLNYGKRDVSLPLAYFQHRLNCIKNIETYKIIFVSDDMPAVETYFGKKDNYVFSTNDEITDFQIIINADIAIISNSSFAWWAAYLSVKKNQVYAPKNWLGFRLGKEHPKMVMTEKFIWCDVFEQFDAEPAAIVD
jgi:hypothetical protein